MNLRYYGQVRFYMVYMGNVAGKNPSLKSLYLTLTVDCTMPTDQRHCPLTTVTDLTTVTIH